jgi:beta-glucosidase
VTVSGSVADGVTVSVPVTNVGDRPGCTVVQCYVEATPGGPRSPTRVLRAFAKVAAAPGGTTHAVMHLSTRAFSVWDVATHAWVVPQGEHRVAVGLSSRDLRGGALVPASS